MTPVARVAYQSGLTVLVTVQEAPDDATGAAGVFDGGCGGGASCELAALAWLVALPDVLASPGPACANAAASPAVAAVAAAAIATESDLMRPNIRRR